MSLRSIQGLYFGARIPVRLFSRSVIRPQQNQEQEQSASSADTIDTESGRPLIQKPSNPSASTSYPIKSDLGYGLPPKNYQLERLRIVPSLTTFFSGNPVHEENMNRLNAVLRKYINLPTKVVDAKTHQQQKRFISFEEYKERLQAGTRLKPIHHKELTTILHRLRSIEPQLMPEEVEETLREFIHSGSVLAQKSDTVKTLDNFGRSLSHGRRKTSKARVYLSKGDGEVIINGRSFMDYFPLEKQRARINYPFVTVGQEGQFNVFAEVVGGGIGGQCEAIMYAISKGLIVHNPLFKSRLHHAGLMTRDTRVVERKKPGKLKARKMPAWVKR